MSGFGWLTGEIEVHERDADPQCGQVLGAWQCRRPEGHVVPSLHCDGAMFWGDREHLADGQITEEEKRG